MLCATLWVAAACSRPGPEADAAGPEGFAVPAGGSIVLVVGEDGSFSLAGAPIDGPNAGARSDSSAAAPPAPAAQPRPFPVAVAPSAIQSFGSEAILAVNRKGLYRLRIDGPKDPSGAAAPAGSDSRGAAGTARMARIEPIAAASGEFAGRTVSGSWARDGAYYVLLYRHPVWETEAARSPPSAVIRAIGDAAGIADDPVGPDAYAVYPRSARSWLIQTRSEDGDRIVTSYAGYDPSSRASVPLSRKEFERQAQPEPLSTAPAPLSAAAAALSGPLLVEAKMPDGSRRAYVRGDPGEAAPAWCQIVEKVGGAGMAVLAADDWRIAVAVTLEGGGTSAITFRQGPPSQDARVRDAALAGGLVVLAWEDDLFPDVGAGGIVLIDPGL